MKKTDLWIILIALLAAGVFFTWNALSSGADVQTVRITVDGKPYKTVSLKEPQTVEINIDGKTNIVEINEHGARMIDANCPDKLCVHQGEITKSNQTIVCLPNKVVVEFYDAAQGDFDAISE